MLHWRHAFRCTVPIGMRRWRRSTRLRASIANLIGMRRHLAGSLTGGIKETQELLDFCAEDGVLAEIEKIPIQDIEKAYTRMLKSDVKYRFVIDMASLKQSVPWISSRAPNR